MKTNECDCNNCENYEPKQAEPKYKVGDEVMWDGVWSNGKIDSRKVRITSTNGTLSDWVINDGESAWGVDESSLSPLSKPELKLKAGRSYQWDGRYSNTDDNCHVNPQEVRMENTLISYGHCLVSTKDGKDYWYKVPFDSLSPLPAMHIGKVWTLKQEGHECYGLQMKCAAQDGIVHNYQTHVYGHNNTVSDLLTTGGCVKYSHNDYIINCIDPEFWTGKIEGEWVRCYEDEDGYVRLHTADDWDYIMDSDYPQLKAIQRAVWLSAIKAANIPIMPYAQSNGNYTPPAEATK